MDTQDTGLSRMLLWWTWKMGMPAVNDVFYPGATTKTAPKAGEGAAAVKSLLFHQGLSPPLLAWPPVYAPGQLQLDLGATFCCLESLCCVVQAT